MIEPDWRTKIEMLTAEDDPDQLWDKHKVARLLDLPVRRIEALGRSGALPRVVLGKQTVRYKASAVRQYIRDHSGD